MEKKIQRPEGYVGEFIIRLIEKDQMTASTCHSF
jgi:hypothetical protein